MFLQHFLIAKIIPDIYYSYTHIVSHKDRLCSPSQTAIYKRLNGFGGYVQFGFWWLKYMSRLVLTNEYKFSGDSSEWDCKKFGIFNAEGVR